jgi:uncharacterized protein (DUF983 family)
MHPSRIRAPRPAGRPSFARMAARAILRRCPRCGGHKAWFTGWFARSDRCLTCGYRYERQAGFLLGALTMNTITTLGLFAVVLAVGSIVTYPDIAVWPIIFVGLGISVFVPILIYPITYTLWAAFDLQMRPLDAAEEAEAITALAARSETGSS